MQIFKISFSALACCLLSVAISQPLHPRHPKDFRVPIAEIVFDNNKSTFGYVMDITEYNIVLHQNYNWTQGDPPRTIYDYQDIKSINFYREGHFGKGFFKLFFPLEGFVTGAALSEISSGWAPLVFSIGSGLALPPAILLGLYEWNYGIRKEFPIEKDDLRFRAMDIQMSSKIKPTWEQVSQTKRGKAYLEKITEQTYDYPVTYQPFMHIWGGYGLNFSTFNQSFRKNYPGTFDLKSNGSSISGVWQMGMGITLKKSIEIGYQYQIEILQSASGGQNVEGSESIQFYNSQTQFHNLYGLKHLVHPNFNQNKRWGVSAGAGLSVGISSMMSSWYIDDIRFDQIPQNFESNVISIGANILGRAEYFFNDRLSIYLMAGTILPVSYNFKSISISGPVNESVDAFKVTSIHLQATPGIRVHF